MAQEDHMKILGLITFVLLSNLSVAADVQFKENSALPSDVRFYMSNAIQNHCPELMKDDFQIMEAQSIQTKTDSYISIAYTAVFKVTSTDQDEDSAVQFPMIVQYIQNDNSRPAFSISASSYCEYADAPFKNKQF